jgi:hydroxyacyl-ACP dehydratase HTD2-like protein with hotdog domain
VTDHSLRADPVRLLLFGAVTHNTHRIHYDPEFARSEGLPAPVVMVQLHGCLLFRAAAAIAGGNPSAVRSLSWRNVAAAPAGTTLSVAVEPVAGSYPDGHARLELTESGPDGTVYCRGNAVVAIPADGPR